jgi:hypothetical protein
MFVGILAEPAGLSRNDRATELFFDYVRAMKPHVAIESLSPIHGPAVVFDEPVWLSVIILPSGWIDAKAGKSFGLKLIRY